MSSCCVRTAFQHLLIVSMSTSDAQNLVSAGMGTPQYVYELIKLFGYLS